MEKINDGGPAFPSPGIEGATDGRAMQRDGMSLRDWLAGQVIAGMMAYGDNHSQYGDFHTNSSPEDTAAYAYKQADALLKVREESST